MQQQSGLDKMFMRGKDILLICGAIYTFAAWGFGIVGLPPRVAAQEDISQKIISENYQRDLKIQELQQNFSFIKESLDMIRKRQDQMMDRVIKNGRA